MSPVQWSARSLPGNGSEPTAARQPFAPGPTTLDGAAVTACAAGGRSAGRTDPQMGITDTVLPE